MFSGTPSRIGNWGGVRSALGKRSGFLLWLGELVGVLLAISLYDLGVRGDERAGLLDGGFDGDLFTSSFDSIALIDITDASGLRLAGSVDLKCGVIPRSKVCMGTPDSFRPGLFGSGLPLPSQASVMEGDELWLGTTGARSGGTSCKRK